MDMKKLKNKIEICKWKFAASINDCEQLSRKITDSKDHYEALAKGVIMGRDIFL
ncbi:MAG: hypothetical protein GY718_00005, partial [Lentisphaerae bacterium]|nr:hypothetical protein [Lentisphaerota bacterium]